MRCAWRVAGVNMIVAKTDLSGVFILEPTRHSDNRGFFSESWNKARMEKAGLFYDFVQDNHSLSAVAGTLRGLHYQSPPYGQAKLVRCAKGRLFDVAVDIRNGSPTYGQWTGVELSFENGKQILVPEGFLHGFITREPDTEIVYKVTNYYNADSDGAVFWDSCGINWGHTGAVSTSAKDTSAIHFDNFASPFNWSGS